MKKVTFIFLLFLFFFIFTLFFCLLFSHITINNQLSNKDSGWNSFVCTKILLSQVALTPKQLRLVRVNPPDSAFRASFNASYAVFRKYQLEIHHDTESECNKMAFQSFLVDGPLSVWEYFVLCGCDSPNLSFPLFLLTF